MASKKARRQLVEEELAVDMSPMIDLVFLLLIFFLVNANMITVKMDKKVEVPIAENSEKVEDKNGRIVINIYEDGMVKDANGTLSFDSDTDLIDYIEKQRLFADGLGHKPSLHLRGHRTAVFKHARRVINCAAKAGVEDVRFAAYMVNPGHY